MDVTRGSTQAAETPLAFAQTGAGRDVVLLHGALTNGEDMALGLFPTLSEAYRVTAFDRPGHGRSGRSGPTGSPWRQAEQVHSAILELGLRRPILIGHSFGGAVALSYALQFPAEVEGVVALAPIAFPELRLEHFLFAPRAAPVSGHLLSMAASATTDKLVLPLLWRAMFLPQEMPAPFRDSFPFEEAGQPDRTEATGEDAVMMGPGLMRSAMNYPFCRTRVHILAGEKDQVVNPNLHSRGLARVLPNAKLEVLPGLGHMVHHFAQGAVIDAVRGLES